MKSTTASSNVLDLEAFRRARSLANEQRDQEAKTDPRDAAVFLPVWVCWGPAWAMWTPFL